mmetsp:Transcript_12589/g.22631  ORF Transcript_12589/g.22631 Transcript_12589/m.22631 type:complete len:262 (+) Transcript_12589:83-868(+)
MRTAFLALACVACAGNARRVAFNPSFHTGSSPAAATRAEDPSMMARRKKVAPKKKKVAAKKSSSGVASLAGITIDTADLVGRSDDSWLSVFDPNGLGYFDPAGFTLEASPDLIRTYREAELKHGRIAMLATLGFVVGEKFHPLFGGNLDGASLLLAKDPELLDQISVIGWSCFGLALFAIEAISALTVFNFPFGSIGGGDYEPGDIFAPFGGTFDPLGLKPSDPGEFKVMQTKELNNGRLAMLAIMGMVLQEWKTGQPLFG